MLITNGTVITLGSNNRMIENGAVYIKGDKIADIGTTNALAKKYRNEEKLRNHENKSGKRNASDSSNRHPYLPSGKNKNRQNKRNWNWISEWMFHFIIIFDWTFGCNQNAK